MRTLLLLGVLLVAPILFGAIPWKPLQQAFPFLPGVAGQQFTQTTEQLEVAAAASGPGIVDLSAWAGYGVLIAWIVVILGAAAVLLKRRDA